MERPAKRPRLSVFEDHPSDSELVDARFNNDMTLKGRFESIFAKYAQDFTGIGDEIDIITGEVIVNNGHLESMMTEIDPGTHHSAGDFTSAGRSMLRAMTVTSDTDLPGPDDVLMSIETIAENAALADDMSNDESEDSTFERSRTSRESTSKTTMNETNENFLQTPIDPYDSDNDSLFNANVERSPSVDSLFANDEGGQRHDHDRETTTAEPTPVSKLHGDEDIIARFGPHVGKEVLDLIDQRQDAHIEPAWRIPVKINTIPARQPRPRASRSSSASSTSDWSVSQGRSLWTLPRTSNRRVVEDRPARKAREESVDPLQEDMSDYVEELQENDMTDESEDEGGDENKAIQEIVNQASVTGECPYCHGLFRGKSGIMVHWDRCLRNNAKRPKSDDPHDWNILQQIRANKALRARDIRLVLYDFRTMIELHEGAGMSFQDIAASQSLRTGKNGPQLQGIYNRYRTPPEHKDPSVRCPEWTQVEELALHELCENPLTTMTTLRRSIKRHDELDIGNHLADFWLSQLGINHTASEDVVEADERPHIKPLGSADSLESPLMATRYSEVVTIKQEESGEELFDDD